MKAASPLRCMRSGSRPTGRVTASPRASCSVEALEIRERKRDERGIAALAAHLGSVSYDEGELAAAAEQLERALEAFRSLGEPTGRRVRARLPGLGRTAYWEISPPRINTSRTACGPRATWVTGSTSRSHSSASPCCVRPRAATTKRTSWRKPPPRLRGRDRRTASGPRVRRARARPTSPRSVRGLGDRRGCARRREGHQGRPGSMMRSIQRGDECPGATRCSPRTWA